MPGKQSMSPIHPHTHRACPCLLHSQLEKLQAAVLELGVPATEFLPVVCDLATVGGWVACREGSS